MIYFIVTTSIFNDCDIRKNQYINGVNTLKKTIKKNNIENYEIIVVENNGLRNTYLDDLQDINCKVYYTNNNASSKEKGYKELQDVLDTIEYYKIKDDDFIVKMTGRYILDENSEFIDMVRQLNNVNHECIIRYGSFGSPLDYKTYDCITGLIGMRCCYIKQIEKPKDNECIEWKWAKVTYLIDDEKIYKVKKLGIHICPGSNNYYLV
jgi:hypothetical protein